MHTLINVGVAQISVADNPAVLRTILGSCIGICIYDKVKKTGGLAHILLPTGSGNNQKPEKYADTAIPLLLEKLDKAGCKRENMSAKITGGASMFKFNSSVSLAQIGERNIEMTIKQLEDAHIPIMVAEVGGSTGRVIDFYLEDGRLKVRSGGKEKVFYKV
ncbi:MAG: chemotaxis protein CheD [Spirochaetes bacterium]|nr:chemotaxis protein CheD [Spirochaetota bacterium]